MNITHYIHILLPGFIGLAVAFFYIPPQLESIKDISSGPLKNGIFMAGELASSNIVHFIPWICQAAQRSRTCIARSDWMKI